MSLFYSSSSGNAVGGYEWGPTGWYKVDQTSKERGQIGGGRFSGGGGSSGSSGSFTGGGGSLGGLSSTPTPITAPGQVKQDYQQGDFDPWSAHRKDAGTLLAGQMGSDPSDIYKAKLQEMSTGQFSPTDPSYQWRFDQGQQALERSLAAKGMLNSGGAAIELQQYGQGAASQEYGAQFDRMLKGLAGVSSQYDTQMQRLMSMAGVGLDPTGAAKVNIEGMKANTNLYNVAVDADTQRYTADVSAAASRANAATNAAAGIRSSEIGSYSGDMNAFNQMNQQNYEQTQQQSYEDALSSSLFFGSGGYGNMSSF